MTQKTVLVTGASGYIGNAVARAFSAAGWRTYGLTRRADERRRLAIDEIVPLIGSPDDLAFLTQVQGEVFDVIVSSTEDQANPTGHFANVQSMLDNITSHSAQAGSRALVMFSSGCKDYGRMSQKHGSPNLAPHTETSPLNPPAPLVPRCSFGESQLQDKAYDATVLRPTIVYGHSSSHYGGLFALAANSKGVLKLLADPDAIMHSLHVDDCARAYVALAEHPHRKEVAGQAFNLSNATYETARQIGEALARSYGLGLEFDNQSPAAASSSVHSSVHSLANFWQWVSSEKVRKLVGWHESKPTFVDGLDMYRLAYEACRQLPN